MTRKKHLLAVFLLLSTCLSFMRAVDEVEIPVESSPEFSGEQTPLPSVQESPQSDSQPMSGLTLQTGEFTPFIPTPRLVISEVFFDGSDERFEIANIGSGGFSGELIIQGAKSSDVHIFITLGSGEVGVRGDTMSQISDKKVIRGSGLGLSISDTLALNMSLLISGQIADTFSLPAGTVSSLPNLYGFEKVRSGGELHILSTSTGRVANISGTRVANPGVIRTLQPSVVESTGIVSDPPIPAPPPATGETTT